MKAIFIKGKKKQGFGWLGSEMVRKHKERIYENIKASKYYEKKSIISSHIEENYKKDLYGQELMLYYSIARHEKLTS